ncbi:MAG: hypothetical protein AAB153_02235 [Pseudomonadota bacterium]|jgi:molybdopterin synthase sulfur carrier subunit
MAKLLYFAALADRLGRTSEETALPATITDVRTLLAWLRGRGGIWEPPPAPEA